MKTIYRIFVLSLGLFLGLSSMYAQSGKLAEKKDSLGRKEQSQQKQTQQSQQKKQKKNCKSSKEPSQKQEQGKDKYALTYDFSQKRFEGDRARLYYPQRRHFMVRVVNIPDTLQVRGDISDVVYRFQKNTTGSSATAGSSLKEFSGVADQVKRAYGDLKELVNKQKASDLIYTPSNALADTFEVLIEKIIDLDDALKMATNLRQKGIPLPSKTMEALNLKINVVKAGLEDSLVETGIENVRGANKTDKDAQIENSVNEITKVMERMHYLNFDRMKAEIRELTKPMNIYYFPEYSPAGGEEIQYTLEYKGARDGEKIPFTPLNLPPLMMGKFLRLGFGTGPMLVWTPGLNKYTRNDISGDPATADDDSVSFSSFPSRNKVEFAMAAFTDLDYQITPTVSFGVGVGAGLNVGESLSGNLYSGINVGFRVARQVQVSLRTGVAVSQRDELLDELGTDGRFVASTIPNDGFTQKTWKAGMYFGVTVSYLTKSISGRKN